MTEAELPPESLLIASVRVRDCGQLDSDWDRTAEQPGLEAVLQAAAQVSGTLVIGGGEPTLRADMPSLLDALGQRSVLATDGLALHNRATVESLVQNGLRAARLPIHSSRADAHDWLVGIPGAHRRARSAVAALKDGGVDVGVEVVLTRPTITHLEETVAHLIRLGVSSIRFRMLNRRGPAFQGYVSTAPRFGLMQPALEAAIQMAMNNGIPVQLQGLPQCAIPGFQDLHIPQPSYVLPVGVSASPLHSAPSGGCEACPAECSGAPKDYVDVFGWTEFESEAALGRVPAVDTPRPQSGETISWPPGRNGRQPATRVVDGIRQAEVANLGGDPMAGRATATAQDTIAVRFPASESTRAIRMRLVQAAQQGATILQVVGTMDHPEAITLLREAQRLSFPIVVLTGDITALVDKPKNQLFHLRGLKEIWIPAGPENEDLAKRIQATASVPFRVIEPVEIGSAVHLFGAPDSTASQHENEKAWPQWAPAKVHCPA
jgi:hypothetical protein